MNTQHALRDLITRLEDRAREPLGTDDEARRWTRTGLNVAIDEAKSLLRGLDETNEIANGNRSRLR